MALNFSAFNGVTTRRSVDTPLNFSAFGEPFAPPLQQRPETRREILRGGAAKIAPTTIQMLGEIQEDPLGIKEFEGPILKRIEKSAEGVGRAIVDELGRAAEFTESIRTGRPISEIIGKGLGTVTGAGHVAFSPITTVFDIFEQIPGVKGLSKLIVLPFALAGDIGGGLGEILVEELPVSEGVKANLREPVRELSALAGQLFIGIKGERLSRQAVGKLPNELLVKVMEERIPVNDVLRTLRGQEVNTRTTKFVQGLTSAERKALFGLARTSEKTKIPDITLRKEVPTVLGRFARIEELNLRALERRPERLLETRRIDRRRGAIEPEEFVELAKRTRSFVEELISEKELVDFVKKGFPLVDRAKVESLVSQAKQLKEGSETVEKGATNVQEFLSRELSELSIPKKPRPPSLLKLLAQPKPRRITRPEAVLLRGRLRAEVRGARVGARQARAEIINRLRVTLKETAQVKRLITLYATARLPLEQRGKVINMIKTGKTNRDFAKAVFRIERIANEIEGRQVNAEIKAISKKVQKSPSVAVDFKARVRSLLEGFEFRKPRETTLAKLRETEKFIKRQKELGIDSLVPEEVIKSLAVLKRKPISDLSLSERKNILSKLQDLEKLGKLKTRTFERLREIEKERIIKELREDVTPIEQHEIMRDRMGEGLTLSQRFGVGVNKALDLAQHVDLSISPMDVFFDLLDGGRGMYSGAAFRNFKAKTDANFQVFQVRFGEISKEIREKAKELNMKEENFNRIGIHAARAQKNGREKLKNTEFTDKEIDSVVLRPKELELFALMRKRLDEVRPEVAEVMRIVYNRELGQIEEYFSFMTDWDVMSETEIFQRIGEQVEEFGQPTKNPELGFTKERKAVGKQKIKVNAMEIYLKHMENVAYLLEMGKDNRILFEVANSPEFNRIAGDTGQLVTLEWLDLISRKGGKVGEKQIRALDMLRRNVGVARLGFKLSSAIIQPTAIMDGAALIDGWAFRGMEEVVLRRDVRQFVLNNMPEVKARVGDDPAFLELSTNEPIKKAQEIGLLALKQLDGITASSVGWGAYLQKLKQLNQPLDLNNPNAEALSHAQKVVRRTQSSSLYKDAPLAISRGKLTGNRSFDKALFQFQSFMLGRWSLIRHDLWRAGVRGGVRPDFKNRDFRKAFTIALWLLIATMLEEGLRRASKELVGLAVGKDVEHFDGYTEGVAKQALGSVPFISQSMSVAVYGSDPIPAFGAFEGLEGFRKAFTAKSPEAKTRALVDIAELAGLTLGIPGSTQLTQAAKQFVSADRKDPITGGIEIPEIEIPSIEIPSINIPSIKL